MSPKTDPSIRPDTLNLASYLACLPEVTTNYVKATAGLIDAIRSRQGKNRIAYLNQDEVKAATGLSPETAITAIQSGPPIVVRLDAGRPGAVNGQTRSGEWQLTVEIPARSVLWPSHVLAPNYLIWDRGSDLPGPHGWRLTLALLHRDGLDSRPFKPKDVRAYTGWTAETTKRTLGSAAEFGLIRSIAHGSYVLSVANLRALDTEYPNPRSDRLTERDRRRSAWLADTKSEQMQLTTAAPLRLQTLPASDQLSDEHNQRIQSELKKLAANLTELDEKQWRAALLHGSSIAASGQS